MTTPQDVIARRRSERAGLITRAREFADELADHHPLLGAVVYGSVARGDFNAWSDIDVLVVADELPPRPQDRIWMRGRLQAIGWTRREWRARVGRDPIAVEAVRDGVWLLGSPEQLSAAG